MPDHIVTSFDKDLEALDRRISEMGGLAEQMLGDAIDALVALDIDRARQVVATDPRLDALQRDIEQSAVLTIARRQPMAVDLRGIVGAVRVSGDLERVGDLAANIAKRTQKIAANVNMPRAGVALRHMGEVAALELKDVLDAYAHRDIERARSVWLRDTELDALEDSLFRDLLTSMMEDPRVISTCTHLLFCSKNVERVGDHATNIAETLHYIVTGETLPADRPKGVPLAVGNTP